MCIREEYTYEGSYFRTSHRPNEHAVGTLSVLKGIQFKAT